MSRFRNTATKVVVSVDDSKDYRFGDGWVPADEPETSSDSGPGDPDDTGAAPAGNASTEAWQEYARSKGATDADLDGKTRDELREQFGA